MWPRSITERVFESDSLWSIVANGGSILAAAIVVYVGLVRFSPKFRVWCLTQQYRGSSRQSGVPQQARRTVIDGLKSAARGEPHRAGELLGDVLRCYDGQITPWDDIGGSLSRWLEACRRPRPTSIAVRLVASEQAAIVDSLVDDLGAIIDRFNHVNPVDTAVADREIEDLGSSRVVVSALSGAAVLADAGAARGTTLDTVLTWHDSTYRDETIRWSRQQRRPNADHDIHVDEHYRLGDYNGRLLELIGVTVGANRQDGSTSFIVETRETCYRATEPPSPVAAKQLTFEAHDHRLPVFRRDRGAATLRRGVSAPADQQSRVCPLTAYVSLLTAAHLADGYVIGVPSDYTEPEIDVLVLAQRSAVTRNGASTLSATAGGVLELDQDSQRLDTDELGVPDVARGALREMYEELGLDDTEVTAAPSAVWVATVAGRSTTGQPKGQLVASVLYLGTTSLGLGGVKARRFRSNHARGAFELDELRALALPPGPSGARHFADTVRQLAPQLDQHGLMSCVYSGMRTYGDRFLPILVDAFEDTPWWAMPWSDNDREERPRVCRDVRQVLPEDAEAITAANPRWQDSWSLLK